MKCWYQAYLFVLFVVSATIACHSQLRGSSDPLAAHANPSVYFDSAQINIFFNKFPAEKKYAAQTWDFYRKRRYAYVWFNKGAVIAQASNLVSRVSNLQNEGIYVKMVYGKLVDSFLHQANNSIGTKGSNVVLELLLTAQYFFFAEHVWQGMNTAVSESLKWHVPRKRVAYAHYLENVLTAVGNQLPENEPVYRQYGLLRKYLQQYRALDSANNWQVISLAGKSPTPGDSSMAITQLKVRLFKLGDYNGDTLNHSFSIALFMAIRQFQQRHGLMVDGVLNRQTMVAINMPLKQRIKQIVVNMERSRWLPVFINTDYIAVNIPEFKLHVYHADTLLWSCAVVVGKTVHQTVIFYGELKYVVFSPYWNVPPSIVRKEILPGMNRNSHYLKDHEMEITSHEDGLPVVRQKPGPTNSLGLVKFLFPNSYNIYLHDTPAKSVFNDSARAFSHGCIRVQEPVKLAAFLLRNNSAWDSTSISNAMHAGKERYDTLTNKVPVFIAYFTAFTDRDNKLNFRKDIYNLDEHMATLLTAGKSVY